MQTPSGGPPAPKGIGEPSENLRILKSIHTALGSDGSSVVWKVLVQLLAAEPIYTFTYSAKMYQAFIILYEKHQEKKGFIFHGIKTNYTASS